MVEALLEGDRRAPGGWPWEGTTARPAAYAVTVPWAPDPVNRPARRRRRGRALTWRLEDDEHPGGPMHHGIVLFTSDRGITPAAAARAAEAAGFSTFYVPEHTHIPVRREAAHPGTGDASLPDDRYARTLDPWVSLATAAAVTSTIRLATAVALPVESDPITLAKSVATLDHLSGRSGHGGGGLRVEHRRARRPPRAGGATTHGAAGVRRGDAGAVDPGRGVVRRGVRLVRGVLGLPEAACRPTCRWSSAPTPGRRPSPGSLAAPTGG